MQILIPEGNTDEEEQSPRLKGWNDMPLQLKKDESQNWFRELRHTRENSQSYLERILFSGQKKVPKQVKSKTKRVDYSSVNNSGQGLSENYSTTDLSSSRLIFGVKKDRLKSKINLNLSGETSVKGCKKRFKLH